MSDTLLLDSGLQSENSTQDTSQILQALQADLINQFSSVIDQQLKQQSAYLLKSLNIKPIKIEQGEKVA